MWKSLLNIFFDWEISIGQNIAFSSCLNSLPLHLKSVYCRISDFRNFSVCWISTDNGGQQVKLTKIPKSDLVDVQSQGSHNIMTTLFKLAPTQIRNLDTTLIQKRTNFLKILIDIHIKKIKIQKLYSYMVLCKIDGQFLNPWTNFQVL